jgi:hypothetical protein
MRNYSKAYMLKDLRAFDGWQENQREGADELTDDTVVFVQDDLTVVDEKMLFEDELEDKDYIYNAGTDAWKAFCTDTLKFEIPEDLRYAYEQDDSAETPPAAADSGGEGAGASTT